MKCFIKFVGFIVGLAVIVVAFSTIVDILYKNTKKYFSAYDEEESFIIIKD